MDRSAQTNREQQLIDRLRREATASRPAFSEQLHRRICAAIEQASAQPAAPRAHQGSSSLGRRLLFSAAAAAAACILLLGVATILHWNRPSPTPGAEDGVPVAEQPGKHPLERGPTGIDGLAGGPDGAEPQNPQVQAPPDAPAGPHPSIQTPAEVPLLAEEAAAEVGQLVDATLDSRRWAYLDHDLRLGAELLVERLPWELVILDRKAADEQPR